MKFRLQKGEKGDPKSSLIRRGCTTIIMFFFNIDVYGLAKWNYRWKKIATVRFEKIVVSKMKTSIKLNKGISEIMDSRYSNSQFVPNVDL